MRARVVHLTALVLLVVAGTVSGGSGGSSSDDEKEPKADEEGAQRECQRLDVKGLLLEDGAKKYYDSRNEVRTERREHACMRDAV